MTLRALMRSGYGRLGLASAVTVTAVSAGLAALPAQASTDAAAANPESAAAGFPAEFTSEAVRSLVQEVGVSRTEAAERLERQATQIETARQLTRELDASSAGSWIDAATGELVVGVTSDAAAQQVRTVGARAKQVTYSSNELTQAKAELDRLGDKATGDNGLTWGVDVKANSVVVQVPRGSSDHDTQAFVDRARSLAPAISIERVAGAPRTHAFYGGAAIYGGGSRCSAGFIAEKGGTQYVVTAGHCTNIASTWESDSGAIGSTVESNFPGNDYGLIEISDPASLDPRGAVLDNGNPQDITGAGQVPVGSTVCKTGSTTGTTCGQVLAYDTTVNYPQGSVSGLTETDVCTQGGDSGGALFAGSEAQGITSGGTTVGCDSSSFRAYFQPVDEALSAYGLTLK